MSKDFKDSADLFRQVRADLGNQVVPELLTTMAALTAKKVAERLATTVHELQPAVPPTVQDPRVYKFPPKAIVMMIGDGTPAEVAAYTKVFEDVNETYLKERAKFLVLLREGGIK